MTEPEGSKGPDKPEQQGSSSKLDVPEDGEVSVDVHLKSREDPNAPPSKPGCLPFAGILIAVVVSYALRK
jgi:hypothetical protein